MSHITHWEEHFRVCTYEMDPAGKAHFTTICNYLQEGASMHAEKAGFGFDDMKANHQTWVLARIRVSVNRFPLWNENVRLKTWSRGREGAFYLRDFELFDERGKAIACASSSWAAINTKTRRPCLVQDLEKGLFTISEKVFEQPLEKLSQPENLAFLRKMTVNFSDIDIVYHVNNVKYVELILNSFPKEQLISKTIRQMEVNYLGEAAYGDVLAVFASDLNDHNQSVVVVRESDKQTVCRAKISWK